MYYDITEREKDRSDTGMCRRLYDKGLQPADLGRVLCDPGRVFHKIQCVMNSEAWVIRPRVRKSRYWWETLQSPIHCCDVTKPPYLFSGELCTSPLHCKLVFVYTVCCRRGGQCFSVLRTRKSEVILAWWATVVGEITSPSNDTMCHSCAPVH